MYIVKLDNEFFSGFGKFYLKDYEIFQPVLESRVNEVGHFSFTVYPSHPLYQNADIPKKLLTVSRFNQSQPIFTGRLSEVETGLYNEKILTFESEEAFLLDSVIVDFYSSVYKSPAAWLDEILTIHNNHSGTYGISYSRNISRTFQLGKTSEILKTSRIAPSKEMFEGTHTTFDIIKNLILNEFSAVLKFRHEKGINFVDCLTCDDLSVNSQTIDFGQNLINITKSVNLEGIATAIRPVGENVETTTETTTESKPLNLRLFDASGYETDDIKQAVNDAVGILKYSDCIYSKQLVHIYGWIQREVAFEGVTNQDDLAYKAVKYLQNMSAGENITINAADLSRADSSIENFSAGDMVVVNSPLHKIYNQKYLVKETVFDLSDISESTVTFGNESDSITSMSGSVGSHSGGGFWGGGTYDPKGSAEIALKQAKEYTDSETGKINQVLEDMTVDSEFNAESTKPVQNKVVTEKFSTTDSAISSLSASLQAISKEVAEKADSENVYTKKEVDYLIPNIDNELNLSSTNPVQNKAVAECINHDRGRLTALEARNEFTNEEKSKLAGITNPMVIKGRVDTEEDLPATAEIGWFYFVGAEDADYYEEYCYSETGWEYVGLSQEGVDLSNYYTKNEIDLKTMVDSELNLSSTNPVQNKAVAECINDDRKSISSCKTNIAANTAAITNLQNADMEFSKQIASVSATATIAKSKAEANAEAIADMYTKAEVDELTKVDDQLSTMSTSTRPVQNVVVSKAISDDRVRIKACEESTALNQATLGYQKKNLFPVNTKSMSANGWVMGNGGNNVYKLYIPKGEYIFSFKQTGTGQSEINFYDSANVQITRILPYVTTANTLMTYKVTLSSDCYGVKFYNSSGANTYSEIMMRPIDITDDTFEPYVDDVDTRLNNNVNDIIINKSTLGYQKKNLLNNFYALGSAHSWGNVSWKTNSDRSITVKGTASGSTDYPIGKAYLTEGKYIFTTSSPMKLHLYNGTNTSIIQGWSVNSSQTITITESNNYVLRIFMNSGDTHDTTFYFMLRNADITDDTYEPYVESVDERLNKFETQLQLYSNTAVSDSYLSINIRNLFTNYSAVLCNAVTSSGNYSLILPLKYIKSLGTGTYYTPGNLLFYYVDDNTMEIRTGLGQSNPTISNVKIIGLY